MHFDGNIGVVGPLPMLPSSNILPPETITAACRFRIIQSRNRRMRMRERAKKISKPPFLYFCGSRITNISGLTLRME